MGESRRFAAMARPRVLVPVAAVIVFVFGGWTLRNKLAADRQGTWVQASRGDLVTGFEVTGTLRSVASDSLGPPALNDYWDFKISMLAPEGSDAKKGQPVLAFDSSELQRKLEEKTAEADEARKQIEKERNDLALQTKNERLRLAEAEANLRKTEFKLGEPTEIQGGNERQQAEIENAIAKRETAAIGARIVALARAATARIGLLESKQREAEAVVERTQNAIRQMNVTAPRDGTVVYITNWRGEKKKVGDSTWRAEKIIEIPDLTRMTADGEVDEADAGRVVVGQRVTLRLDAHPDDELHGTITAAGRTVQQKKGTQDPLKILRVGITLDKTDPAKMRPGMRFQGTIELGRVKNAVLIPRDAVVVSGKGPVVIRRGSLSVVEVPVRLGRENDKLVEVLNGIDAGDRVLLAKSGEEEKHS